MPDNPLVPRKRGNPNLWRHAKPFEKGNPGRPKGSRNKLAESFLKALHDDFEENGVAAIQAARAADPLGYVKIVAGLMPQQIDIQDKSKQNLTDAELIMLIQQEREKNGEAIDVEFEDAEQVEVNVIDERKD